MSRSINLNPFLLAIPILIVAFLCGLLLSSSFLLESESMVMAITLDFCITVPLLYYVAIRKSNIPLITVLSVFVLCLIFASILIPVAHQGLLSQIKFFAVPVVELGVITFVFLNARSVIKQMKLTDQKVEWYDALLMSCKKVLPDRVGTILATEISVIYYSFFVWKKKNLGEHEFTYFYKSGVKSIIGAFIFLIIIETVAIHMVVDQWSARVAWILTALSLYTCLQVWALLKSMDQRYTYFDYENEQLILRYGFFNQSTIPFSKIIGIEANKRTLPSDKSVVEFSPLGLLDSHNMILSLNELHSMDKVYGFKKKYQKLALYIDEKENFISRVEDILKSNDHR